MASSKIKGITIEIGGDTTKLGKAIEDSEKKSRSLQGELKQVDKLLKFDPSNTELLAQKQEILAEVISETSKKLKTLKDAQGQVEKQFASGEIGADQYRAFKREVEKTEKALKDYEGQADKSGKAAKDSGEQAEEGSEGFTIMNGALADLVADAVTGAISAIGDLIGSLMELDEATEEYRQMQAKLEGSADTFGVSVDFAKDKYKEFYGYLGDDQMATNAITNLMGLGTSTESISKIAEASIGVWSAYGDSIPIESLTESINETAQVGKVTGSLADALNWAGVSEDEFNAKLEKTKTTQERADLIAKTLNDTYGDSKKKYDEMTGSITDANRAEVELKDTQAKLGEAIQPVNTAMSEMKNQALQALAPMVQACADAFLDLYTWLQENPIVMKIVTGVVIALATAFTVLATALAISGIIAGVTKAMTFLNTSLLACPVTWIVAGIMAVVAVFIYLWNTCEPFKQFFIDLWSGIKQAFSSAYEYIKQVIKKLANYFEKEIKLIKEIVSGMIEFATALFKGDFSKLPEIAKKVLGKIREFFSSILGKVIDKVKSWGKDIISKVKKSVSDMVSKAVEIAKQLPSKIWSAIVGAVTKVGQWGSQMLSKAKSAVSQVVSGVVNGFKNLPSKVMEVGKNLVQGLWNGISNAKDWILGKIGGFGDSILSGIKSFFGIESPSKVFRDEVGRYLAEGIGVGLEENSDAPVSAIESLNDDMMSATRGLNGVTLSRQLNHTFSGSLDGGSIGDLVALVSEYMPKIIEASSRSIVLDDDTLIGKTIDKIDSKLASNYRMKARGI